MENNLVFNNQNNIDNYDNLNNTLTIKDQNDQIFNIVFDGYIPNNLKINVINSNITIIERFINKIENAIYEINVDENSHLTRFSIIVDNKSKIKIDRVVNNYNYYQSMQIDLSDYSLDSNENINLLKDEAMSYVINGIYANKKSHKKYQTNLNHYNPFTTSKAQIYAVNDDYGNINIYTDAFIKNKAVGTKTNQEGRIINLSNNATGIILPNLHIDENDVEASHSCSVGSVNKDHLYYLQTRGLSEKQARNILIKGYFNPLLENVKDKSIKEKLNELLDQKIGD